MPGERRSAAATPYDFLVSLGTDQVAHANVSSNFLNHLSTTSALLASWGCDQSTVNAGLYHSVYGTAAFDLFSGTNNCCNPTWNAAFVIIGCNFDLLLIALIPRHDESLV